MKTVVVAIDGSEESRGVIDYALHYADREKDADLLFVHVIERKEYKAINTMGYSVSIPPGEDEVKEAFEKFIKEQIKASGLKKPKKMSVHVEMGTAYSEIVSFAEKKDADIIMIGHRGLSGLEGFLIGTVASKVVAHSPCSVYVHRVKSSEMGKQ